MLPFLKRAGWLTALLWCVWLCPTARAAGEISHTYTYKGYDTNGTLLVSGVIALHVDDNNQVTGTWTLHILDRDRLKELGPQDGSGKIIGTLKGEKIIVNLNPSGFGDNVYLEGRAARVDIGNIDGKWGHYGFYQGKIVEGTFEMNRKVAPPKAK